MLIPHSSDKTNEMIDYLGGIQFTSARLVKRIVRLWSMESFMHSNVFNATLKARLKYLIIFYKWVYLQMAFPGGSLLVTFSIRLFNSSYGKAWLPILKVV